MCGRAGLALRASVRDGWGSSLQGPAHVAWLPSRLATCACGRAHGVVSLQLRFQAPPLPSPESGVSAVNYMCPAALALILPSQTAEVTRVRCLLSSLSCLRPPPGSCRVPAGNEGGHGPPAAAPERGRGGCPLIVGAWSGIDRLLWPAGDARPPGDEAANCPWPPGPSAPGPPGSPRPSPPGD